MPSPSQRIANHHAIRNHPNKASISNIQKAVEHKIFSNSHSQIIPASSSVDLPVVDIGTTDGIFKFEIVGSLSIATLQLEIEVSNNGILFLPFPHLFTTLGLHISATYDMTFRYHKIKITNPEISSKAITVLQSGRH